MEPQQKVCMSQSLGESGEMTKKLKQCLCFGEVPCGVGVWAAAHEAFGLGKGLRGCPLVAFWGKGRMFPPRSIAHGLGPVSMHPFGMTNRRSRSIQHGNSRRHSWISKGARNKVSGLGALICPLHRPGWVVVGGGLGCQPTVTICRKHRDCHWGALAQKWLVSRQMVMVPMQSSLSSVLVRFCSWKREEPQRM